MFKVNGGWSDWQNVTNCSTTCGEGVMTQQCTCTQPSPSCGGRDCLGENVTNISCTKCCPGTYVYKLTVSIARALHSVILISRLSYIHTYVCKL